MNLELDFLCLFDAMVQNVTFNGGTQKKRRGCGAQNGVKMPFSVAPVYDLVSKTAEAVYDMALY